MADDEHENDPEIDYGKLEIEAEKNEDAYDPEMNILNLLKINPIFKEEAQTEDDEGDKGSARG